MNDNTLPMDGENGFYNSNIHRKERKDELVFKLFVPEKNETKNKAQEHQRNSTGHSLFH
ncbi:MAG: hypothetical protein FWD46_08570 [Cystobacterineae bacterium]|nr:hypothetical protein [Cystobacterineae bacterium]